MIITIFRLQGQGISFCYELFLFWILGQELWSH